jgi:predicted oxidoreductase (fatty acid repression mutant protein)
MEQSFGSAIGARRTFYSIGKGSPVSDERIRSVIAGTLVSVPSAFNSQSARTVLLLGQAHDRVWSITLGTLRKIVPPDAFARTEQKINSFAAGHGTVLYFDDTAVTEKFAQQFPAYRENFPVWAQQASGMLQFAVWTALEQEGLGASLQHYNPLIDDEVKKAFGLPQAWKLIAEMPFGEPSDRPGSKKTQPADERMRVIEE